MPYYKLTKEENIGASTAKTLTVNDPVSDTRPPGYSFFDKHNIVIDPGTSTTGTITVTATSIGGAAAETVFEDGVALVINLATSGEPFTRQLDGYPVQSFTFTPASLNGGNDWDVSIVSGY